MIASRRFCAVVLSSLCLTLTACPAKKSPDNSGPSRVIFVKGDPNELIAGSTRNLQSPFNATNARQLGDYRLITLSQFVEREAVVDKAGRDLEKENAASTGTTSPAELLKVELTQPSDNLWVMKILAGRLSVEFKVTDNGQLQPVRVFNDKESTNIQPLHWSESSDGNYLSLLVAANESDTGRALIAFYFEKSGSLSVVPTTDSKYKYIAGAGNMIGWKGPDLNVQLCGRESYKARVESSIGIWARALQGRLNLKFSYTSNYLPFSDVNQHCIFFVDSYLREHSSNFANYGITLTLESQIRLEILDSDIFIFENELNKLTKLGHDYSERNEREAYSLTHELGHLLGLDHKFALAGELTVPSIMSYAFLGNYLTTYDVEAISQLYPLRKP